MKPLGLLFREIAMRIAIERPRPRRLVIDLRDNGSSFDFAEAPKPNLNEAQIHGYGLFLVKELMDEVTYEPGPTENHWRLIKHLF